MFNQPMDSKIGHFLNVWSIVMTILAIMTFCIETLPRARLNPNDNIYYANLAEKLENGESSCTILNFRLKFCSIDLYMFLTDLYL